MNDIFEIAYGSITGNDHRWSGRNNQDAYCCLNDDERITLRICFCRNSE